MSLQRTQTRDKGISLTPHGYRAQVRINGHLHRRRFPKGTPIIKIREWLLKTEMRFRGTKPRRTGKFADDARVYLEAVKAMPTYTQRKQHIDEWIAIFGDQQRDTITSDEIAAQLHRWRTEPRTVIRNTATREIVLSASAVNQRRTALQHLYRVLDGKAASNPVKDTPRFREPSALPKGLPYSAIKQLWKAMGDTQSRARLMVIAYTGIPHAQLKQIRPEDVDGETVRVHGRKKGQGTAARVVPLTKEGMRAFKAMARTDAWGGFSASSLRRAFQRACANVPALKPIAHQLTPYDLRHSFGTEVYRSSGDIRATQVLMGHSSPVLTHRYTLAAVDPRLAEALKHFGKRR